VTQGEERLLTFEIGGLLFAMPIAGVLEVAEMGESACVPGVPPDVASVINYRGDALPVVHRTRLFDRSVDSAGTPEHVLVVSDRASGAARLGLDIDRVLGLVDGAGAISRDGDPVAERRPLGGRVAHILDPARLVERARLTIEGSLPWSERETRGGG
jgi:hypothetical protein